MDWFVGITTAPRQGSSLLPATVESLRLAGWDSVTVAAEPDSNISGVDTSVATRVLWHPAKQGAWGNFLSVVRMGVDSGAERIAIVQDDVQAALGLREYLERTACLTGWYSPYAPGYATEFLPEGWGDVPRTHIHRGHGGCFLVCTFDTASRFLKSLPRDTGPNGTDNWIAKWCRRTKTPLRHHNPSLVQHVGEHSTIHHGSVLCWMRKATNYCNDARRLECSVPFS